MAIVLNRALLLHSTLGEPTHCLKPEEASVSGWVARDDGSGASSPPLRVMPDGIYCGRLSGPHPVSGQAGTYLDQGSEPLVWSPCENRSSPGSCHSGVLVHWGLKLLRMT